MTVFSRRWVTFTGHCSLRWSVRILSFGKSIYFADLNPFHRVFMIPSNLNMCLALGKGTNWFFRRCILQVSFFLSFYFLKKTIKKNSKDSIKTLERRQKDSGKTFFCYIVNCVFFFIFCFFNL